MTVSSVRKQFQSWSEVVNSDQQANILGLEEGSEVYPSVFRLDEFRVIRCPLDIQYIAQRYKGGKWRSLSFHVEWDSLVARYPQVGGKGG
jgi:hypothetical protein